jgi:BASS family bile acid:Na+ symporter
VSLEALIPIALKTSIFLSVVSLGLGARARDVGSLVHDPWRFVRSMAAMTVIMPAVAVALAIALDLEPAVKIALVALSVSPVPPLWPKRSIKAGGRASFTLGLLVATAGVSVAIIPLAMEVFERVFAVPLRMSADDVARTMLITVLLPLFLGVTVRQLVPRLADDTARPLGLVAMAILVAGAAPILIVLWPAAASLVGDGTLLAMVVFVLIALATGHLLGGPPREDRSVLALACASRHPAIAIAIAQANFPDAPLVPGAVLLYLLTSGIVSAPYLRLMRRHMPRPIRPLVTAPRSPR